MKTIKTIVVLAIMAIATTQTFGQAVGINNDSPVDTLDVGGTARFSNYIKVGNPTAPATQTLDNYKVYDLLPDAGWGGADVLNSCGGTNAWGLVVGGTAKNYFQFTGNTASRSFSRLLTAWFWIPTSATFPYIDLEWSIATSDVGYDGMYFEYTLNGTTFTKLTPIGGTAYGVTAFNATTGGMNPATCAAPNTTGNHWSAAATTRSEFLLTGLTGRWIRLAVPATNDVVAPAGIMRVFGISVECAPAAATLNSTFQTGCGYFEKNVYAGNNVLMGDVAEYYRLNDKGEPGMIVSLSTKGTDQYELTKTKNDSKVIGVISTSPTVTLNSSAGGTPIALAGRVPVCVTNENGSIEIGDYLTSSSTPGYAMKAVGNCYVIGKAVEPSFEKSGKIICIIGSGWKNTGGTTDNIISGDFSVPKGKSKIIVKDASVTKNSKIFLSPGIKVSKLTPKEGLFEIVFSSVTVVYASHNYLVVNSPQSNQKTDVQIVEQQDVSEGNIVPLAQATAESLRLPSTPDDPDKFWIFTGKEVKEIKAITKTNVK